MLDRLPARQNQRKKSYLTRLLGLFPPPKIRPNAVCKFFVAFYLTSLFTWPNTTDLSSRVRALERTFGLRQTGNMIQKLDKDQSASFIIYMQNEAGQGSKFSSSENSNILISKCDVSVNSKPDHPPLGDPRGLAHFSCPRGRVFAPLSCLGVCPWACPGGGS